MLTSNARAEYHAALLHLRMQARCFAEAFAEAASAAQAHDPEGGGADPLAQKAMVEIAAVLQTTCDAVPGAAEVFALALTRKDS